VQLAHGVIWRVDRFVLGSDCGRARGEIVGQLYRAGAEAHHVDSGP